MPFPVPINFGMWFACGSCQIWTKSVRGFQSQNRPSAFTWGTGSTALSCYTSTFSEVTATYMVEGFLFTWRDHVIIRPTQPSTLSGTEMSTSQSAVMLCGWGV